MDLKRFLERYGRFLAVSIFLLTLLVMVQMTGLREHFSLDYLRQALLANRLGGLVLFVLLFTLGNLVQIPGWIFLAAAVLVLGRTAGGLVTYLAAVISCAVTFVTIALIGGDAIRQWDNRLANKLLQHLQAHPVRNIALLRTLFQTLPALNYALALSGIGFKKYMAASLLGLPLPIAVYCLFFDYLAVFFHAAGNAGLMR